ncbi:hypothetical protein SAMD00019534_007500 [Acytostelium subglobosum LB1]|uniref:hypothetical protein n=1 Tax=Acytostelium subglobosum LB1 TaxID=1410327 RepID=UPI000644D23C|nr:hypothetical protein SAMD00019534_007500 [Acytostelium subglobosum LB1]GAM17575.1 hypothetical protein SAMD00019534_007500 [Acytostelium subglobosum LB1]|eukprot:XP_012759637.1 hypothetical protein SAMD00019534_007500 [Acytostelium subglobosum LB1]
MTNNNILPTLLVLLLTTNTVLSLINPNNDHEYILYNTKTTATGAINACAAINSTTGRGFGYLATITTLDEWNWVNSAGLFSSSPNEIWISGRTYDQMFQKWYYNSGPENGMLFYDSSNNGVGCLTYCPWALTEPSLSDNEIYLSTFRRGGDFGLAINNLQATESQFYLCEFGGMGSPIVNGSTGTSGGVITFKGYSSSLDASYTPTSVNLVPFDNNTATPSPSLTCPINTNSITSSGFTCNLPSGAGLYNVNVTFSNGSDTIILPTRYQYIPAIVRYIYPNTEVNSFVTIVGDNFGTDLSKVSILLGAAKTGQCNDVKYVNGVVGKVIQCTITNTLTESILPIRVVINGVMSITNNAPFYDTTTNTFLSFYSACATFTSSYNYSMESTLENYSGYPGTLTSAAQVNIINTTVSQLTTQGGMKFYEGITYVNSAYKYTYGPNINKVATPYFSTSTPSGLLPSNRLYMTWSTLVLTAGTDICAAVFTQFGGYSPVISYTSTSANNIVIPSAGQTVAVKLANPGHQFSTNTFLAIIKGQNYTLNFDSVNNDRSSVSVKLPAGYGGPHTLLAIVDGVQSNTLTFGYPTPSITSVSPSKLSTEGAEVTVYGANFYTQQSLIKVVIDQVPTGITSLINDTAFTAQLPAGTGKKVVIGMVLDNIASSNTVDIGYLAPNINNIVNSATNIDSGVVTITGTSFGANISKISVQGIQLLSSITMLLPHKSLSFKVPALSGTPMINITVDGQMSNTVSVEYQEVKTTIVSVSSSNFNTTENVTITGTGFGSYQINVTIGGQQCDHLYYINSTVIVCNFKGTVPFNGTALPVEIYSDGALVTVQYLFFYANPLECPNDCSSQGTCLKAEVTAYCQCYQGFGGRDCSIKLSNSRSSKAPVVNPNGTATLPSDTMTFNIGVKYIREVSQDKIIRSLDMSTITWTRSSDLNKYIFIGEFPNDTCKLNVTIMVFLKEDTVKFAGELIPVSANSVKFYVNITNWSFQSNLNILQLIYQTSGDRVQATPDGCPYEPSPLPIGSVTFLDVPSENEGVVISAKYSTRLISDSRPGVINTVMLDGTSDTLKPPAINESHDILFYTAMLVPHFSTQVDLDPNFGLLLKDGGFPLARPDCKAKSGGGGSNDKWKVPVITVLVIVGFIAIVAVTAIYVKKRLMGRRLKDVAMEKISRMSKKDTNK